MMITKLKAYAAIIGTLLLTILTLGGYARYQKRRADEKEEELEISKRIIKQDREIKQRIRDKRRQNNKTRAKTNEYKSNRTYFDNL